MRDEFGHMADISILSHLHYGGIATFNKYPASRDLTGVDYAVMGVPFDVGTTNRSGARLGPRAIRAASPLGQRFAYPWGYDLGGSRNIVDFGDVGYYLGPDTTKVMLEETHTAAKYILDHGCGLLTLGGDHTIPYGMVRAAAEKYGPVSLLHFDSHQDSDKSKPGTVSHANFSYDLAAEGCIDPTRSAQVFIRTDMPLCGYNIFYAQDCLEMGMEELARRIKDVLGDNPVYLTFDIDALDPAFAPGTGTPVPGGPATWQVRRLLYLLRGINVVAGDLVEVLPAYDSGEITALVGSTIAQDILYLMDQSERYGRASEEERAAGQELGAHAPSVRGELPRRTGTSGALELGWAGSEPAKTVRLD